jgi:hypothetical protein
LKKQYQCRTNRLKSSRFQPAGAPALRKITTLLLVIGVSAATQGCSNSHRLEKLTGRVTLSNGAPLVGARLIFHPNDTNSNEMKSSSATTDKDGYYSAGSVTDGGGIAPGEYMVSVIENVGNQDHPTPPKINAKYSQVKKSGLQVTVPTEGHTYDIVLDPI